MAHILVTGGSGYIGTCLVPRLLDLGHRVRVIDRLFFGDGLLPVHPRLDIIQEDARYIGPQHLQGIDVVIDLVAISNDPSGEFFQQATRDINHLARVRTARMARQAGCRRYILPSSCSIYGFLPDGVIATEQTPPNPLTTYAHSNAAAEHDVLDLADSRFCVVVLRQATVFGVAPRMRFDLAINGMTYGAWKTGRLPLMRDGTQSRPMLHVRDAATAMIFMLDAPVEDVNGEIFNVGAADNNYRIGDLGRIVAEAAPRPVEIEWYGDPDHRSYSVCFDKIEALGYRAGRRALEGVREIWAALDAGTLDRTPETITLDWYKQLDHWERRVRALVRHGGMIDLPTDPRAVTAAE